MGLQTKIVVSFLSVLGCLSVMSTGVYAILYASSFQVENNSTIQMQHISGNLYGYRYGAGEYDIANSLLYENGEVADINALSDYLENVEFGTGYSLMEYIFHFELTDGATDGVFIMLDNASLTPGSKYIDRYQFIYQETEPSLEEWADIAEIDGTIVVDNTKQDVWLRASLSVQDALTASSRSLSSSATWTFSFSFTGMGE